MPVTLVGLGSLFGRDQRMATARILDGAPPYVDEERILHVLEVVERLGRLETGPVPSGPAPSSSGSTGPAPSSSGPQRSDA
jgi:hypothetical protein